MLLDRNEPSFTYSCKNTIIADETPAHPKNVGHPKSINMESCNCNKNVMINVLVSQFYPVKNPPYDMVLQ